MRAVEIQDEKNKLLVKYEYEFDIDGENFTESVSVSAKFGFNPNDNLVLGLEHESGSRLYYKKIAKQIKNLYAYCKK